MAKEYKIFKTAAKTAKENNLVFKDKELDEILSTLSRLYDVDIYYENPELKRLPFTGSFKQYEHLDKIIRMIEDCGLIRIKQDGKTLTISK